MDIQLITRLIVEQLAKEGIVGGASANAPAACGASGASGASAIAAALEHSLLNKDVTMEQIAAACAKAKALCIGGVVVPPWHVAATKPLLAGSSVKLVTAISFPNGGQSLNCKLLEIQKAKEAGADEIDLVPNFARLQRERYAQEQEELKELIAAARPMQVKINIEWGMFSQAQLTRILKLAVDCRADYVKVQHFLAGGKAQACEVEFIRATVANAIGVKIDGGIKTAEQCLELMRAGANRMGLTATFAILEGK